MNLRLLPLPRRLVGTRVLVRTWARGDGAALFALVERDHDRLAAWLPWPRFHRAAEDSEDYVRRAAAEWALRSTLAAAICTPDGELAGGCGLLPDWELRSFEVGYWIASTHEGRGMVREATALLAGLAFERLDARRVFVRCEPQNTRSAAVPRSLGFVDEGTLRESLRVPTGQAGDIQFWSMLRKEWAEAPWQAEIAACVAAADEEG